MTTLDRIIKHEKETGRQLPKKFGNMELPKQEAGNQQPREKILKRLKKTNRCIGCGSKMHKFVECKDKGYMQCGKETSHFDIPEKEVKPKPAQVRQNFALCEESDTHVENHQTSDLIVIRIETHQEKEIIATISSPGTLRTLHPRTQKLGTLQVLLYKGANRSFIDAKIADELLLANHYVVTMKRRTFGAETAKEIQCIDTCLKIWNSEGEQHKLWLSAYNNLTRNFTKGKLRKKDLFFIQKKHMKLRFQIMEFSIPPDPDWI
ncbi:unnamed protein product [Haemonchus placei]|uniref:DUF1758 domain-containing protein n=1 Tax=Haemonchus placei TaxID=6290 RepID=A0A0N4WTF9_HAEPC|nr:unnamed protein product [Haemonchus placei]